MPVALSLKGSPQLSVCSREREGAPIFWGSRSAGGGGGGAVCRAECGGPRRSGGGALRRPCATPRTGRPCVVPIAHRRGREPPDLVRTVVQQALCPFCLKCASCL